MDECMDGMFEKWYDKIDEEESMEDRRKVFYDLKLSCLESELFGETNGVYNLTGLALVLLCCLFVSLYNLKINQIN